MNLSIASLLTVMLAGAGGNRFVHLDGGDPFAVDRRFARLATPQWVGEKGVAAVVTLGIDDMRAVEPYEKFLRPILERLQRIDGRAPVSIFTCSIDPAHPQLARWLGEGLSIEVHTVDHPCPILAKGDFGAARSTVDRCIEMLWQIPGSRPAAFRTPCCDSLNTASPRLLHEVLCRTTPAGKFLALDSSVFHLFTADDPELPRELVLESDGSERFRKYLPLDRSYAAYVENYPYPYVLGGRLWEMAGVVPSDWAAQHRRGVCHPDTIADLKAAIDLSVAKEGVLNLVFHPHGWILDRQVVELIDHAVGGHPGKIRFLTFKEVESRLREHLLAGEPLRAADGGDNGVRVLDLNGDGWQDVVIGNERVRRTRLWNPRDRRWTEVDFPISLVETGPDGRRIPAARFGAVGPDAVLIARTEKTAGGWRFTEGRWSEAPALIEGLEVDGMPLGTVENGRDAGIRLRDLDGDGVCELLAGGPGRRAAFRWDGGRWRRLTFGLPDGVRIVDDQGRDAGTRFVDLDEDGRDDIVSSNEKGSSVHLFESMSAGWSRRGAPEGRIPPIVRGGQDNGAWFHSRALWVQNETTAHLPGLCEKKTFGELIGDVDPPPRTPEESLRMMHPRPGFVVELMAAEPLLADPVAFQWGPDGKLWVAEMHDYPSGIGEERRPGGRVRVLEDVDGDGSYDRSSIFLDGLRFANGVLPWRDGALVTAAPEILFARDTDGDGRADERTVLFSGFGEGNQQHRVNGLEWGLDNWVYCANGDSGGRIRSTKTGVEVDIRGRDLRIRPDSGEIEPQTGQTQFGRNKNDWGDWFGGNNANPMYHFVLDDHYLKRNPRLVPPIPWAHVSRTPGAAPVFPTSRTLARFNDFGMRNRFTSACSPMVYRDVLFGPAFASSTFVSEPVHNLVHREILEERGAGYVSRRAADESDSEFLSSSDNWFRPAMLRTGPDGALWIADMYRKVIEHPEYIPAELQKGIDFRAGDEKGRLYRVYPVGVRPRPIPRLDRLGGRELAQALDSPSGWQRDMAQMLLVWRREDAAAPLAAIANGGRRPEARLHALCTLDGIDRLTPEIVATCLSDAHPAVRRHAVRLSERFVGTAAGIGARLVSLVSDPDPKVRLQLAYSLGEWKSPAAARALAELARRDGDDRYASAAIASSAVDHVGELLRSLLESMSAEPASTRPARQQLVEKLVGLAVLLDRREALAPVLAAIARPRGGAYERWQFDALAELLETLAKRKTSLERLRESADPDLQNAVTNLNGLLDAARKVAGSNDAPLGERTSATKLVGRWPGALETSGGLFSALLSPRSRPDLQIAAIEALAASSDDRASQILLDAWKGLGPHCRASVLDALLSRPAWAERLLAAVETGAIAGGELDAGRRERLLSLSNEALRARAAKALRLSEASPRANVLEAYRPALDAPGDQARGEQIFKRHCSLCHRLNGVGFEVGPDLAAVTDRSPLGLLVAILDPNRAVETKYLQYLVQTDDGRSLVGLLAAETGASVVLRAQEGKETTIARAEIDAMSSTGRSLMPEGMEKDLRPEDVRDLIAFLSAAGPRPKMFPGNQPAAVAAGADGTLVLDAATAEIHGPSLVFEERYRNLGYWTNAADHAAWTIDFPRAGRYEVLLEWACPPTTAGNVFALDVGGARLEGKVMATGSWDDYQTARIGSIEIAAGRRRAIFRPAAPPRACLLDLRSIRLVPAN